MTNFVYNAIFNLVTKKGLNYRSPTVIGHSLECTDVCFYDPRFLEMTQVDWIWIYELLDQKLKGAGVEVDFPTPSQISAFRGRMECVERLDRPSRVIDRETATSHEEKERVVSDNELKSDWKHLLNCMESAQDLKRVIPEHDARCKEIASDAKSRGLGVDFLSFAQAYPTIFEKVKFFFE